MFLRLFLIAGLLCAQTAPPQGELERTEQIIQALGELKTKVAQIEAEIDVLLKALSEQKGALQNRPAYNALEHIDRPDAPAAKKAPVRCAAYTNKGERCTRPAVSGSRYCRQHQLANNK